MAAAKRSTNDRSARPGLDALLASKEMIVVCGSGGTGKTTISASLGAIAATQLGARVLVLTVDPARRLATALGLGPLGTAEVRVAPELLRQASPNLSKAAAERGQLWVGMLDTKAGWDELIRRHAPDAALREHPGKYIRAFHSSRS